MGTCRGTGPSTNPHDLTKLTSPRSQIFLDRQPCRAAYNFTNPNLGAKNNFWEKVRLVDLVLS